MAAETETAAQRIERTAAELGLTLQFQFVPYSACRKVGDRPNSPTLNWRVTLQHNGRTVLETTYSAGCGHCPSYRQGNRSIDQQETLTWECEHGQNRRTRKPIVPALADVLSCWISEAEAIDYPSFEDWADSLGYDQDSRSAERTYRACLETGLRLRTALGDAGLSQLREACQDY